jgi:hypothetical protein
MQFEEFLGVGPPTACLVLGVAYVTYAHYRSNSRALPGYHQRHIANLRRMTPKQMKSIIEEVRLG